MSAEVKTELVVDGLDRVSDAARFLGVSQSAIYGMMTAGVLPYVLLGKSRRIPHRAVVDLAARNLVGGGQP
jgi:excisionase family DNA binding protein